eukprot:2766714-Pleurochrysis_carterae.AAC.1
MFAFSAMKASHGLESASAPAFGLISSGIPYRIPWIKILRAMLRGELLYAELALASRNLKDILTIADAAFGTGATQAALRAQVEHENKIKRKARYLRTKDRASS